MDIDKITNSPLYFYIAGAIINIIFISILLINATSYRNLQLPEGNFSENLWKGSDVLTYVAPARNFLKFGVFGKGTTPDAHRTIGYPLLLAVLMKFFGEHWLILTLFVQALVFASIYPAIIGINKILFPSTSNSISFYLFIFLVITGSYVVFVPVILTDLFFTTLFTLGFYFGLIAIIRQKWHYLIFQVFFIGYAAQVRPVLVYYPIVNLLVLFLIAEDNGIEKIAKTKKLIITSFLLLMITCNLPVIRNYINYGFLFPTDVLACNMFDYLGKAVLDKEGKNQEYAQMAESLQPIRDIRELKNLREEYAINIYKRFPLTTLKQILHNAAGIMGRSSWDIAAAFMEISFKDKYYPGLILKKSEMIFILETIFNIAYFIIYVLTIVGLIHLLKLKRLSLVLILIMLFLYFLLPTFMINGTGSRMRLPVEAFIVMVALWEIANIKMLLEQ